MLAVAIGAWVLSLFAAILVASAVIDNAHEEVRLELKDQVKAAVKKNAELREQVDLWRTKARLLKAAMNDHPMGTRDK